MTRSRPWDARLAANRAPGSLVGCKDTILIASADAMQSRAERCWWMQAALGAYLMLVMHVALFNELACVAHRLLHALARAHAEISLEQLVAWKSRAEAAGMG